MQIGLEKERFEICAEERQRIKAEVQSRVEEEEHKRIFGEEWRKTTTVGHGNPYVEAEAQL